ncbi:MAG: hypothetical protein NUV77_22435 [Thermoguttaceae bacterium]|nr:hypothetical protein [Thermoguttaceae bacterium]
MIRRVHVLWGVALAASAVGLLGAVGCKQSETAASNSAAPATRTATGETTSPAGQAPRGQNDQAPTARAVLENMVSAYKRAAAYADKGTIRLQAKEGDQAD